MECQFKAGDIVTVNSLLMEREVHHEKHSPTYGTISLMTLWDPTRLGQVLEIEHVGQDYSHHTREYKVEYRIVVLFGPTDLDSQSRRYNFSEDELCIDSQAVMRRELEQKALEDAEERVTQLWLEDVL